jgi:hypothetical protein
MSEYQKELKVKEDECMELKKNIEELTREIAALK